MLIRRTITAPHGLLFVSDARAKHEVPADTGAANVTTTETSVAFWVLHEVDGEATIELTNDPEIVPTGMAKVFDGTIKCPSRNISVSQPDLTEIASLEIATDEPKVAIYTNDPDSPDQVVIQLSS